MRVRKHLLERKSKLETSIKSAKCAIDSNKKLIAEAKVELISVGNDLLLSDALDRKFDICIDVTGARVITNDDVSEYYFTETQAKELVDEINQWRDFYKEKFE